MQHPDHDRKLLLKFLFPSMLGLALFLTPVPSGESLTIPMALLAEFTPLFHYLGKPMVPLLEWMRVPEPAAVSETLLVGIADMFILSIMAASIDNEMSRFIVATLSVTQLIYMSEVGALLLGSRIPIGFGELVFVFLLRTAVTLPVIVLMSHAIVGSD